ncbi:MULTISPECIES: YoaK family protein [Asticcacaulis]|uniref:YoaK family protein n=1 Tax=Asticcacaulis TaxID=76890 RepID=UPI001AE9D0F8|nr:MULTISPECIES: YoaK family protein [Asticcacaulis]MBP2160833.1 uncharacterized membrane protein YoaK (UPF0700 family) [Asticcacaulis solisilvae]MDR6801963.1 uncharacterized membrane protein YoaK (UPF0700 family) [Asticcacaulis sp. BE141]
MTDEKPHETLPVAALLILAAGQLDAYTYVAHGGVFANAMTGNIVIMTVRFTDGDWHRAIPFIGPLVAYVLGVMMAACLKRPPMRRILPHPAESALALEIAFLILVAFLPDGVPDMLIVSGIAFVAALQATAFTRIESFDFTSVTISANLRRFAEGFMASVVFDEEGKSRRQWRFFLTIVLCFIVGALMSAFATTIWGNQAVWLPMITLSIAFVLCLSWRKQLASVLSEH